MFKKKDLVGLKFGRLTVLYEDGKTASGNVKWRCLCDCGVEKTIPSGRLLNGNTKSCGCLLRALMIESKTTHGLTANSTKPELYRTWSGMKDRCYYESSHNYPKYGGRGIIVCDRWKFSFTAFLEDMGPKPSKDHSLDRIDNNGNYEPGNCRWATKKEQSKNTRTNVWIEAAGKKMIITEWGDYLKIDPSSLTRQLRKKTIEQIIKEVNEKNNRLIRK